MTNRLHGFSRAVSLLALAGAAALAIATPALAATHTGAPTRIVATTQDLAALAREVGGDRVTVVALASGMQDPHQVDPKPSFIAQLNGADLLIVVGRELEIGWLPPLITASRNARIHGPG